MVVTPNMKLAAVSYAVLAAGLFFRKRNSKIHAVCMLTGIGIDLWIVVLLQMTRSAIQTALTFSLTPLQQMHIAASTAAVLLYFPVVYLGICLIRRRATSEQRRWHIRFGISAFAFRSAGFLLMFSFAAGI